MIGFTTWYRHISFIWTTYIILYIYATYLYYLYTYYALLYRVYIVLFIFNSDHQIIMACAGRGADSPSSKSILPGRWQRSGVDEPMKVRPPHRLMPGKCIGFESPLTDIDCSYIMLYYVIRKWSNIKNIENKITYEKLWLPTVVLCSIYKSPSLYGWVSSCWVGAAITSPAWRVTLFLHDLRPFGQFTMENKHWSDR